MKESKGSPEGNERQIAANLQSDVEHDQLKSVTCENS